MPFRNRNNNRFDISLTLKSNSNEEQYGLSDAGFYFRNSVKLMILLIPHIKEKLQSKKIEWVTLKICADEAKLFHKKDESLELRAVALLFVLAATVLIAT